MNKVTEILLWLNILAMVVAVVGMVLFHIDPGLLYNPSTGAI